MWLCNKVVKQMFLCVFFSSFLIDDFCAGIFFTFVKSFDRKKLHKKAIEKTSNLQKTPRFIMKNPHQSFVRPASAEFLNSVKKLGKILQFEIGWTHQCFQKINKFFYPGPVLINHMNPIVQTEVKFECTMQKVHTWEIPLRFWIFNTKNQLKKEPEKSFSINGHFNDARCKSLEVLFYPIFM